MPKILLAQLTGGIAENGTDTRELTFRVEGNPMTGTEAHTVIIKPRFYGRMGMNGRAHFVIGVGTEQSVSYKVAEQVGERIVRLLSGERIAPLYGEDTILQSTERPTC